MAKTNAEHQQDFRSRKKGITEEEKKAYLKKNADDMKRYRAQKKELEALKKKKDADEKKEEKKEKKSKLTDTEPEIINEIVHETKKRRGRPSKFKLDVDTLAKPEVKKVEQTTNKKHNPLKSKNLAEASVKAYVGSLNSVLKLYGYEMPNEIKIELEKLFKNEKGKKLKLLKSYFQFIENNPQEVLAKIREHKIAEKNMIKAITVLSSRLSNFKNTYNIFSDENIIEIDKYKKERQENDVKEEDKEKIIDISYQTAKTNMLKLDGDDKLIYALYTLNPPRRLLDYHQMSYEVKPNSNYIIKGEDGKAKTFHFGKYKTKKYLGEQDIDIHPELAFIVDKYMETHWDFPIISSTSLNRVFKKLYDVEKISVNFIRISYLTGLNKNGELSKMNERERTTLAKKMGHSRKQQNEYIRQVV
jgi:hypothetical protein